MKTATIRQLHHDLRSVLAMVEQGEEVTILKRTRPVARLCPPLAAAAEKVRLPDFNARAKAILGERQLSNTVLETREERPW